MNALNPIISANYHIFPLRKSITSHLPNNQQLTTYGNSIYHLISNIKYNKIRGTIYTCK